MNWMIYYLLKNPEVKARVIKDLESTFPENLEGKQPLTFTRLNKVSLLEHVETECLRLHPPIGFAMPRDTPPQGAVIAGIYVPGGVTVGVPAATIGRNPDVYSEPDRFDPDRWSWESQDVATMKTCYLGFGAGSRYVNGAKFSSQIV